ncbi:TetR/AcrR family transcriptional regulator [Streptomyces sp. VRA16 Mangrove soil]|uniref:TetR/AcrR family transcriptional regulator n=1 Tax=Streptomyces sp. VRA16 Mangrove soil TaxID=2817434 RepID=UPI001A9E5A03|nr:TetR/AcrR family transcriptional regulator [Streptomyces sp. VRA16 Mangrove soil]MBO1332903.1 TetR family transcriptional regulator [Streptomyces sp. VRA16 Mangrove soil]
MPKKPSGAGSADRAAAAAPARRAADRGRYGRLSRERVLATALEIVDRDGLSALSMRGLGAELGVEAMALYRYADGKDALLDGLVETFFAELESRLDAAEADGDGATEAEADGDGVAELDRIAGATYAVALEHPHVVPLLATRLLSTPLARRPAAVLRTDERILALLLDSGMAADRAVRLHRAFTAWLLGWLMVELRAVVDDPDEPDPAFRLGLHRLPARELPRLRECAALMAERGGKAGLSAGLQALLRAFGEEAGVQ